MIADDDRPILMDFGSAMKARIKIENRSQALLQQDIAAEQSTMAYRAPELFDVKTGITIDEKVDIWVCAVCSSFTSHHIHATFTTKVPWLHVIRPGVLTFTVREHPDNRAGRFNSYGGHERSVQTT
jgi:serine/threonine protein kinase